MAKKKRYNTKPITKDMKAKAILINWALSFMGLGMESVDGGMLWSLVGFSWFMISTLILIKADKKGILNNN